MLSDNRGAKFINRETQNCDLKARDPPDVNWKLNFELSLAGYTITSRIN